jgi:hypothetical protein
MKKTLWLLIAAVALLVLVLGVKTWREGALARAGYAFDTTQVGEVVSLRVVYQEDTSVLVRKNGKWVTALDGFTADSNKVRKALRYLLGIRSTDLVSQANDLNRLAEYGLDSLDAKLVEWRLASGETGRFLLGKTAGSDFSSTYWKWEGKPEVYRTFGNFTYDVPAVLNEWKDRHLLPDFLYENVNSVEADWIDSLGVSHHYRLERTSDTSVKMTEPVKAPVPRLTAAAIFEQTPQFTTDEFVERGDTNVSRVRPDSPVVVVRIGMKDGRKFEVRSGGLFDGFQYVPHPEHKNLVRVARWRFDFFRKKVADILNPALEPSRERGVPEYVEPPSPEADREDH